MSTKLLAGICAAAMFLSIPQSADAGHRRITRIPNRVINSYQRDVRQFQRQRTRTFNQFDRSFRRSVPIRNSGFGFAPRSNAVFLGGSRGGVYFRF